MAMGEGAAGDVKILVTVHGFPKCVEMGIVLSYTVDMDIPTDNLTLEALRERIHAVIQPTYGAAIN